MVSDGFGGFDLNSFGMVSAWFRNRPETMSKLFKKGLTFLPILVQERAT
jgi:hypothetical protein